MTKKRWIQKINIKKGSLKNWAERHKLVKDGKIELGKALRYAKRHQLTKRIKQINLAKTLRRIRKRR